MKNIWPTINQYAKVDFCVRGSSRANPAAIDTRPSVTTALVPKLLGGLGRQQARPCR